MNLRVMLFLIIVILLLSALSGCAAKGSRTAAKPQALSYTNEMSSTVRYDDESSLIQGVISKRASDIEVTWFDENYRITERPTYLSASVDFAAYRVEIKGTTSQSGNFLAIAFDKENLSYAGCNTSRDSTISLATHPAPGVVIFGACSVKEDDSDFHAILSFAPGSDNTERMTAKAPSGDDNSVDDLLVEDDAGNWRLTWTEKNLGDYTNDGEVGIPDITPIATHFDEAVNHDDPDDIAAIIDGDFNNEVGVSDITPIATNYLHKVAAYSIYRFEPGVGWSKVDSTDRPEPDPAWRPLVYNFSDALATSADTFYAVLPADDDGAEGIPSAVVGVPGANPALIPDPPEGITDPPVIVDLQVSDVLRFNVPAGDTESFDVMLENAETNYILAFTNPGVPGTSTTSVTVSTNGVAKSGTKGVSLLSNYQVSDEAKLNMALKRQAQFLLEYGKHPALPERGVCAIGDTSSFNIVFADLDPSTLDGTISAKLKAENERIRIWVDVQVDDGRITSSQMEEIAAETRDYILAQEEITYGEIYDVDSDSKFDILLTPQINVLPGKIRGLFVSNDLQDTLGTNSRDLIYLDVPDAEGGEFPGDPITAIPPGFLDSAAPITNKEFSDTARQEIAHEMQHLINFSNRLRIRDRDSIEPNSEETWLNEALSHFSEDFIGYQGQTNLTMAQQYLNHSYVTPIAWPTEMDAPIPRGGSYLFIRYIYEQFGTDVLSKLLLRDLPDGMYIGFDNVERATGNQIENLMQDWLATMSFVGWDNSPEEKYRYQPPQANLITGNLCGITFLEGFTDYRGNTQYVPQPLIHRLGDAPLTVSQMPNTPMFVLVNDPVASAKQINIAAGSSYPVYGVFVRVADQAQAYENDTGSTPFEFFRLFSGDIDNSSDSDEYLINVGTGGRLYVHAVSCIPDTLEPVIYVNDELYSGFSSPSGAGLVILNIVGGGGTMKIEIRGSEGSTGSYLLSAEYYPE